MHFDRASAMQETPRLAQRLEKCHGAAMEVSQSGSSSRNASKQVRNEANPLKILSKWMKHDKTLIKNRKKS